MAPKKYYAVRKGKKTGIFQTWDECKLQVTGFSGAEYKSFMTLEEAQQYIGGAKAEDKNRVRSEDCAVAYVDGSFNVATGEFSYGAIIFYKGKEERFCEKYDNPELADMRNVAGELEGSMRAMRYCVENGIKELELYYDYMGIEQWCTGGWKTNKEGTKAYKAYYDSIQDKLKVHFNKVKGHSGDKYNDVADQLAKSALGL